MPLQFAITQPVSDESSTTTSPSGWGALVFGLLPQSPFFGRQVLDNTGTDLSFPSVDAVQTAIERIRSSDLPLHVSFDLEPGEQRPWLTVPATVVSSHPLGDRPGTRYIVKVEVL